MERTCTTILDHHQVFWQAEATLGDKGYSRDVSSISSTEVDASHPTG